MRASPADGTISMRYAERVIDTAVAAGIAREALLRAAPLAPVERYGDRRIPGRAYYELWGAAMELVRDPAFPLRVATATGIETYDVFGFACMTSGTFREGLVRASRYLRIWTDLASWELHQDQGRARLVLVPGGVRHPASRFAAQCAIAEMLHTSRTYAGVKWIPHEVHVAWRTSGATDPLAAFFGAPVRFERPATALVFDAALLDVPLVKSDPAMARYFAEHAEQMLAQAPRAATVVHDVRRYLAAALQGDGATIAQAAKALSTSTRTLRRRLAEEGHTFAGLVQETRCALAKQHLAESRLSVAEIAFVLGFSEASAFHRSFRRWTGETPAAYRARTREVA